MLTEEDSSPVPWLFSPPLFLVKRKKKDYVLCGFVRFYCTLVNCTTRYNKTSSVMLNNST